MAEEHRLSAIMFTDIIGYTAIMQDDEQNALQIIDKNDNPPSGASVKAVPVRRFTCANTLLTKLIFN